MKFGLAFASSIAIDHEASMEICRRAEAAGFESLWGGEHVILPSTIESPLYDAVLPPRLMTMPDCGRFLNAGTRLRRSAHVVQNLPSRHT